MDRKTQVCLWIIIIGLINFVSFVMMYIYIGGDARNGRVAVIDGKRHFLIQMRGAEAVAARRIPDPGPARDAVGSQPERPGSGWVELRNPANKRVGILISPDGTLYKDVGKDMYIYSAIHSILILLTVGAVLLAMLTLAKDHIVTAMERSLLTGRALIHVFATVVVLVVGMMTVQFIVEFIKQLRQ